MDGQILWLGCLSLSPAVQLITLAAVDRVANFCSAESNSLHTTMSSCASCLIDLDRSDQERTDPRPVRQRDPAPRSQKHSSFMEQKLVHVVKQYTVYKSDQGSWLGILSSHYAVLAQHSNLNTVSILLPLSLATALRMVLLRLVPFQGVHPVNQSQHSRQSVREVTHLVKLSLHWSHVTFGLSLIVFHNSAFSSGRSLFMTSSPSRLACRAM